MMIMTVEDLTGPIEVVVFPRTYEKCKDIIIAEDRLLIKGKVGERRDENDSTSLLLDAAIPMRNLSILTLNFENFDLKDLTAVRYALLEFSGETPVILQSKSYPNQMVAVSVDYWVNPEPALIERLSQHLGAENVHLKEPEPEVEAPPEVAVFV